MKLFPWIVAHKAMFAAFGASVAVAATHMAGLVPPPYDAVLTAAAIALAALSGGPQPAAPAPAPPTLPYRPR